MYTEVGAGAQPGWRCGQRTLNFRCAAASRAVLAGLARWTSQEDRSDAPYTENRPYSTTKVPLLLKTHARTILVTSIAAGLLASGSAAFAQAQTKPTPEGAQRFLQQLAALGTTRIEVAMNDADGLRSKNYFNYGVWQAKWKHTGATERGRIEYSAFKLDEVTSEEACKTTFVFNATGADKQYSKILEKDPRSYEYFVNFSEVQKFDGPQRFVVEWAKAGKIEQSRDVVSIYGQVRLTTQSEDMAKRLQYAAEFLRVSCDKTAGTGF